MVWSSVDGPPVLDQALPGLVDGAGDGDPAVVGVGLDGRGHVALSQGDEGISLPLLVGTGLAAVGGEGDDVVAQLLGQRPQRPTGVDGGQLAVVADQDQLGPGRVDMASGAGRGSGSRPWRPRRPRSRAGR